MLAQFMREGPSSTSAGRWLQRRGQRYVVYLGISVLLFGAAVAVRGWQSARQQQPLNFIVSDAKGYYVYLPSVVIDGDVDLLNQMVATFGQDIHRIDYDVENRTPTGVVANKYPVGMALTLFPPFLLAHGVALAGQQFTASPWFASDGYSPPYQLFCLGVIVALSCLTMMLLDRLIEEHLQIDGRAIGAGVAAFWLGSHYMWYCFREPFMVHVISAFWVTLVVATCARLRFDAQARGQVRTFHSFTLAFAAAMALVCRPTNIFIAPFIVWALLAVYRAGLTVQLLRTVPLALTGLALPLLVQASVWRAMYGEWFHYSYDDEGFIWSQPALLATLFSMHKGLFVWTPLLLLAAVGIWWHLRHRHDAAHKGLLACWLVGAGILWYLNSAWWCWGFGWSFGARAFLELAGLFVVGLALAFELARRHSPLTRTVVVSAALVFVIYNYALMGLYQTNRINRGDWQTGGWTRDGAPRRFLDHISQIEQQPGQGNRHVRTDVNAWDEQ
jgi:hypothetical protein